MQKTEDGGQKGAKAKSQRSKIKSQRKTEAGGRNWFYIILLAGLLFIFFAEVILKKGFFWEDFLEQNFPYRLFAARALAEGKFPFWNPYIFGGLPFFADIQTAILFPTNLLLTFFVRNRWLSSYLCQFALILQLLIAGTGMFFFGQAIGVNKRVAFFMAIVYMLNGHFVVHMNHTQMIQTFTFIPLLFLFLRQGFLTIGIDSVRNLIICGLLLGIASYAGYPQAIVIILMGFLIFAIYQIALTPKKAGAIIFRLGLVMGIFLLIALCQYLPTYYLFKESIRSKYSYAEIVEGSFHPLRFITFLVPNYFGTTTQGDFSSYFGPGPYYQYWEQMAYIGIIPLILAGFSFYRNKRLSPWLPLLLSIISLLIALGRHFPLHILLYKFVPFFSHIRTPAKFLNLNLFGIVWLSGIGLENVLSLKPKPRLAILSGGGLLLVIIGSILFLPSYAGELGRKVATGNALRSLLIAALSVLGLGLYLKKRLKQRWFLIVVSAIAFFDLFSFGKSYNTGKVQPELYWEENSLVRFFKTVAKKDYIRVNTRCREGLILPRNMGYVQEFWTTEGYNPLLLDRFVEVRENLSPERFFALMNVKYYTGFDAASQQLIIKENPTYLPRAKVFYDWEVISDKESLFRVLNRADFPFFTKVILESHPGIQPTADSRQPTTSIRSYSINEIDVDVEVDQPAVLVLSENYYQNWQVIIDGKRSSTFPVNYCLRGCVVPKGKHLIKFVYREKFFMPLLTLAILTITGGIVFLIITRRKTVYGARSRTTG